jgi:hypothetical protein
MNKEIWKRLLWKEWRENWLYLAICIGVLMLSVLQYKPKEYDTDNMMPAIFVIILIVVLKTTLQSIAIKPGQIGYKMSMPIPGFIKYLQIYFVSFIMPFIVGLALSFAVIWIKNISQQSSPPVNTLSDNYLASAAILMMISCNALVVVLARILSLIPALVAGFIYLLLILNSNLFKVAINLDYFVWLITGLAITAIVGEILIANDSSNYSNYKGISFKRVAITIISIIAFLFSLLLIPIILNEMSDDNRINAGQIFSKNSNIAASCENQNQYGADILYENSINERKVVKYFKGCSYPVAILDNNVDVLIVQMNRISLNAYLMKWNVDTGQVTKVLTLPKRLNHYDEISLRAMHGNYAILYLRSLIISKKLQKNNIYNYDVWVIDITNSKMKLIIPGVSHILTQSSPGDYNWNQYIKWGDNQLTYYYRTKKFIVDLPSLNITVSDLPIRRTAE